MRLGEVAICPDLRNLAPDPERLERHPHDGSLSMRGIDQRRPGTVFAVTSHMIESNNHNNSLHGTTSTTAKPDLDGTESVVRTLTSSVKDVQSAIGDKPALAIGILAGIGLVVAGGLFFGTRRRRTIFDRMMDLF